MKKLIAVAVILITAVAFAAAAPIQTAIIVPGSPLVVTIPTGQVLRLLNYVSFGSVSGQAYASVTINTVTATVTSPVDFASQETRIPLNVAGPATLTVSTSTGYSMISYKVDSNR